MNTGISTGAGRAWLPLLFVLSLLLALCPGVARGDLSGMRNYCAAPPVDGFKPNLLLMIDNSASMYDPAYSDPTKPCLDDSADTYELGAQYPGYFAPGSFYRYASSEDGDGNEAGRFVLASPQSIPSSPCNAASKGYVCVNITSGVLDNFVASGNFLNWLAMSRLDIEKQALTGGKFDPATGLLQGETRGCQGKRFVKMIGGAQVTFAVRGPIPTESGYSQQASHGGMTRIEVYPAHYNKSACLEAVTDWQQGLVDKLQAATLGCLNNQYDSDGIPTQAKVYIDIMSDCYSYLSRGTVTLDETLRDDCDTRIWGIYGDDPGNITVNTGDDICGKGVFHNPIVHGAETSTSGYLGNCFLGGTRFADSDGCLVEQTADYCRDIAHPWLTDPSLSSNLTGAALNLPGFILEAGISNLGEVAGTMLARVAPALPPTGLIQEFGNSINFGAMVFGGGSFQQTLALDRPGVYAVRALASDALGNTSLAQRNIIRVARILGDLDGDGCVDLKDAAAALRISLGMEPAGAQQLAHGDVAPLVDGVPRPDGVIDAGDVLVLLRRIVGLVDF